MTVSAQIPFNSAVAAGSPTFVYGFRVLDATHLVVKANGVSLVLGVDYSVTGVGVQAGGTVVMTVNPTPGVVVTIQRKTPFARSTDYQSNGDFLSAVVNPDFDSLWMALQDAQFTAELAVLLPAGDTAAPMTLPIVSARAGNYLAFDASGNAVAVAPSPADAFHVPKTSDTGSAVIPNGTTAQRDATPNFGYQRANYTLTRMEWWNGTAWAAMGGGATGGGPDAAFFENDQIVANDYTITAGKNAMTAGPITIANGKTVTVPNGATWSIV